MRPPERCPTFTETSLYLPDFNAEDLEISISSNHTVNHAASGRATLILKAGTAQLRCHVNDAALEEIRACIVAFQNTDPPEEGWQEITA